MPVLYQYQYACFLCRKAFKKSSDHRSDGSLCPECSQPMSYMGTAFRAPKQSNVNQWEKVRLLIAAGFQFTSDGGRKPRTLKDVPAFLEAHRLKNRSPGVRLLDHLKARDAGAKNPVTRVNDLSPRAKFQGLVRRLKHEGRPRYELLGRELSSQSRVLINVDGRWVFGTFTFIGDGMKIVEPHVEVNMGTGTSTKRIFVTKQTVLRWWD